MIGLLISLFIAGSLCTPVSALEIHAPEVPRSAWENMPENTDSFSDGLVSVLRKAVQKSRPDLTEAMRVSTSLAIIVLVISVVHLVSEKTDKLTALIGSVTISGVLLSRANTMIQLAAETIRELSEYGKLLYPVMAAALAAQGGMTSSAALYTGTAVFDIVLGNVIAKVLVPLVYMYLALVTANCALGEDLLKRTACLIKSGMTWFLKTILMVFTTYISISGVVSGTTDAVALKAAKVTISSVVPVVGGILSDASEAVLVSAGLMKNAAGIYGILAILAVFLEPFLRIGIQYLVLKATAAVCTLFGAKAITVLIDQFSSAMGLLLAVTGAECVLLLISTFCFLKGII